MLAVAARVLETMFVLGAVGCVIVLLLTAVEDIRTLFGIEEKEQEIPHSPKVPVTSA